MKYVGETDIPLLVSVDDYKSAVHIGESDLADDTHLELYLSAAQEVVSTAVGIPPAPGPYQFDVAFSGAAWRRFWFPVRPVSQIDKVEVSGPDLAWAEQDIASVRLIAGDDEPQLLLPEGWAGLSMQADRLRITATCGTDAPPKRMSQAVILLVKDWLEAGISIEDQYKTPLLSFGVHRLMRQLRYRRPQVMGCS